MAGDPWRREEGKVPGGGGGGRRPQAEAAGPLRLRDWLVAQIESGRYAGLRWEDAGKTVFRIPWKHAAKQDYRAQQDAALFRAWAIYKGKHHEGIDKEDPPTWKTRLRCALNKSADFREVRESSQLDCADPYKVYRIVSDGAHEPVTQDFAPLEKKGHFRSQQVLPGEVTRLGCGAEQDGSESATVKDKELPPRRAQRSSLPLDPLADHRYQAQDLSLPWTPSPWKDFSNPELRAHLLDGCPEPEYKIRLCFGEEYPGPPGQPEERLIMAHVEPLFARELLLRSKGLDREAPAARAPQLSQSEGSLPPLMVPQFCPVQQAADTTCSPAHTVPVTRESLTAQGQDRGDSGSHHL